MIKHLLLVSLFFSYYLVHAQTQTRDNAGLQGNQGATSGFFETYQPINYPAGASDWWHLLDVRHTNPNNNYAMQFSGSFFDQELYFRKTNHNPAQAWSRIPTENGGAFTVKAKSWFSHGNTSIQGYSWTDAALTTNSIEIVNNEGTVNNSSPTLAFHRYGSGGPQFRLSADGSNILYLESSGANSARSPLAYGGGPNSYFTKLHIDGALSVKGQIRSSEVKVEVGPWPDYVFEDKYTLRSLDDVAAFIKENKHLPEVPSASTVKEEGVSLGEMNSILLKKVEELTLYLLKQDSQMKEMASQILQLQQEIDTIKK
ncbi:hypothetical protein [Pedobacter glucosidilyticus]|uniref:hypothetical protein n=1 Tax=Pedobacter glucosidilyticus TaxID=1122941 RepID=UPI0026EEE125|nr:hypothetical protein [Pedobacter glucosidilyticus]